MISEKLRQLKEKSVQLNYGRELVVSMAMPYIRQATSQPVIILDIGFGTGADLLNIRRAAVNHNLGLYGIDGYDPHVVKAAELGILAWKRNIEADVFPFEDGSVDLVVANQVLEHTKEIFWTLSEVSRILKPGGIVIVGVPNLASLHNRILLLLGRQPSTIELLGPHVRGFTRGAFERFVTADGYFDIMAVAGSNFYPFPPPAANLLSRVLPTMAVGLFFMCQRSNKPGRFIDVLRTRFYETVYYQG
jgi:SAM-dependent methyltransferase